MIQCYVSKTTEEYSIHPRVLHSHEDFIEIIFISKGEGQHLIDKKNYTVKKGN